MSTGARALPCFVENQPATLLTDRAFLQSAASCKSTGLLDELFGFAYPFAVAAATQSRRVTKVIKSLREHSARLFLLPCSQQMFRQQTFVLQGRRNPCQVPASAKRAVLVAADVADVDQGVPCL